MAHLEAAYDAASRLNDKRMDFLGYYVYRPLSFPMTLPFLRAGMSANQVTYLRIAAVLVALVLLAIGGYVPRLIAAALLLAHLFLDLIDGNIARLAGPSGFGGFLDEITDILLKVITPVALAVGLYFVPDAVSSVALSGVPAESILVVGLATGLASSAKAYLAAEARQRLPKPAAMPRAEIERELAEPPRLSLPYVYRTGVSLLIPAIPVFAAFDALSVYLILILMTRGLTFPLELLVTIRRAYRAFGEG